MKSTPKKPTKTPKKKRTVHWSKLAERVEACVNAVAADAGEAPLTTKGLAIVRGLAGEVVLDSPDASVREHAAEVTKRFDARGSKKTAKTKATAKQVTASAAQVSGYVVRSALLGRTGLDSSETTLTAQQYDEVKRLAEENAGIVAARGWKEREDIAFGAKTTDHYRVGDEHGTADMLRILLSSSSDVDDVLSDGIVAAADDLLAFVDWITAGGGAQTDSAVVQRVGDGIQNRLRVLAEMARRMRDAVNAGTAVQS